MVLLRRHFSPRALLKDLNTRIRDKNVRLRIRPKVRQNKPQPTSPLSDKTENNRFRFKFKPLSFHLNLFNTDHWRTQGHSNNFATDHSQGVTAKPFNRNRAIKLMLIISLIGFSTYSSRPAHADVLDPLRRIISPFIKKPENTDDQRPDATDIVTEQATLDPNLSSNPVAPNTNDDESRPSLFSVMHAEFLADRGDIDQALKLYKQEAFKNDATSVFERALALSLRYESAEASLTFARQWQLQNPEHIPALFYVAHLALKASEYDLAGEALTQILEYDPQADLSEILIGIYPNNETDQRSLLETLLGLPKHNNASLLVMQAGLMSQLGQSDIALLSINRALKTRPDNAAFIILKADILKQLEPDREVLAYVSEQRQRLEDSKGLYLYEIRYRLALGETHEAWELLMQAHQLFHDEEVTLLAALVSIDIEAYSTADELLAGLAASPYYIDQAYYYLGISAERQHNYDAAERYLSKVSQENLALKARQKLVTILLSKGEADRALDMLQQFGRQYEVYAPESAIMQADILRQQNKLSDAQKILESANHHYPDDTKLLFARVQLLDNEKDASLKRQLLDRLLLLNPEQPDYQLSMATLLFESGNDEEVEQAITSAQSIINIPFDSPLFNQNNYLEALNIIAADALSKEQYQEVVNYLESVYDVSPNLDTGIILLRGYQGLGQQDKVTYLFNDIQQRFALGQQDISDRLQSY